MSDGDDRTSSSGGGRGNLTWLARKAASAFGRLGAKAQAEAAAPEAPRPSVDLPFLPNAPESDEWHEIEAGFALLADQGLWLSVLERLRGVDQSRQQFRSGKRYVEAALAGALDPVTRHLGPTPNVPRAVAALPMIEAVRNQYPKDYVASVLHGAALSAIGWALRGPAPPDAATPEDPDAPHHAYFAQAEAALEVFDPIVENSPMLAEARYMLAPGLRDGDDALRDWYEDWADLDPSNPAMLMAHGRFLMPEWFGSFAEIGREARRATGRAVGGIGRGAYVYLWRPALEAHPQALSEVDTDLFLQGLMAAAERSGSQRTVNDLAVLLVGLASAAPGEPASVTLRAGPARARLALGLRPLIERHLREIHVPLWPMDEASVRAILANEFRAELATGATIRAGKRGLDVVPPGDSG